MYSSLWNDLEINEKKALIAKQEVLKAEAANNAEGNESVSPGLPTGSLIIPETTTIWSDSNGSNRVPMIHVEDLSSMLLYGAEKFAYGVGADDETVRYYYPATDAVKSDGSPNANDSSATSSSSNNSNWTMSGLFHQISEKLLRSHRFTSQMEVLDLYCGKGLDEDLNPLLVDHFDWLQDISFASAYPMQAEPDPVTVDKIPIVPTLNVPGMKADAATARSTKSNASNGNNSRSSSPERRGTPDEPIRKTIRIPEMKYPNGICENFSAIWKEYLNAHQLKPCVIVTTGPAKVGKTALSEALGNKLKGLTVVDPLNCVKEVIQLVDDTPERTTTAHSSAENLQHQVSTASRPPTTVGLASTTPNSKQFSIAPADLGASLKSRIVGALEIILKPAEDGTAAKPPPKGKKTAPVADTNSNGVFAVDLTTLTDETLKSLPTSLIRECISYKIYALVNTGICKGCVLDLNWGTIPDLFTKKQHFEDVFCCKNLITMPTPPPGSRLGRMQSSLGGVGTPPAMSGRLGSSAAAVAANNAIAAATKAVCDMQANMIWPEMVLELQCDGSAIIRKQMQLWGVAVDHPVNKLSKDQQAHLHALNESIQTYSNSLIEIGTVLNASSSVATDTNATEMPGEGAVAVDESANETADKGEKKECNEGDDVSRSQLSYKLLSHPCIVEFEQPYTAGSNIETKSNGSLAYSWRPKVHRVDMTPLFLDSQTNTCLTAEELQDSVEMETVINIYCMPEVHGAIGWFREEYSVRYTEAPVVEAEKSEDNEQENVLGAAAGSASTESTVENTIAESARSNGAVTPTPLAVASTPSFSNTSTSVISRSKSHSRHHGDTRGADGGARGTTANGLRDMDLTSCNMDTDKIGVGYMDNDTSNPLVDPQGGLGQHHTPTIEEINHSLSCVIETEKEPLINSAQELQAYLVSNVLTHTAEGLINIARNEPDDPIKFLYNFLKKRGKILQKSAESKAFDNFIAPLSDSEIQIFFASRGEEVPKKYLNRKTSAPDSAQEDKFDIPVLKVLKQESNDHDSVCDSPTSFSERAIR